MFENFTGSLGSLRFDDWWHFGHTPNFFHSDVTTACIRDSCVALKLIIVVVDIVGARLTPTVATFYNPFRQCTYTVRWSNTISMAIGTTAAVAATTMRYFMCINYLFFLSLIFLPSFSFFFFSLAIWSIHSIDYYYFGLRRRPPIKIFSVDTHYYYYYCYYRTTYYRTAFVFSVHSFSIYTRPVTRPVNMFL